MHVVDAPRRSRAGRRTARRRCAGRGGSRAADQLGEVQQLGDHDQRRRDRNHRLHDAHRHLGHADQRVGREHRHDRRRRRQPSSTKNAMTSNCATMLTQRRARPRHRVDELRAADVRALDRRERRAVEREPREQDRGDLVVPDQRLRRSRGTRRRASPRRTARPSAPTRPTRARGRSASRNARPRGIDGALRVARAPLTCRSAIARSISGLGARRLPCRTPRRSACSPRRTRPCRPR